MIYLEAAQDSDNLKIGLRKPDDAISSYKVRTVPVKKIEKQCVRIFEALNKVGRTCRQDCESLHKLKAMGQILGDELLTASIKKEIRETDARYLTVNLEDRLVHIPWELVHTGEEFLCQRFNMGRNVRTRQEFIRVRGNDRHQGMPLKMWILANPGGDLDAAASEGGKICDCMDQTDQQAEIDVLLDSEITVDKVRERIRDYDFVHFAGHADYNSRNPGQSGWRFNGGTLKADHIKKMEGGAAMPVLVFSNACQSARTEEWEWKENQEDDSFGLANAFMLAGVKHYIGASWEIRDESGSRFALEFYRHLVSGCTIGQAIRLARLALTDDMTDTCWASYILYGNPCVRYFGRDKNPEPSPGQISPEIWRTGESGKNRKRFRSEQSSEGDEKKNNDETESGHNFITDLKRKTGLASVILASVLVIFCLVAAYYKSSAKTDKWTSSALHMTVVFDPKSFNQEKEDIISAAIEMKILEYPRIRLVDRMTLDWAEAELKLNESGMVDSAKKLKKGRLLPADIYLFVKVHYSDTGPVVVMRLKDTETGTLIDVYDEPFQEDSMISVRKEKFSRALLKKLKELYPLRGRISETRDSVVRLNIGNDQGVQIGQCFIVADRDLILKVISVKKNSSVARIEKGKAVLEKGSRVEAQTCEVSETSQVLREL